MLRSACYLAVLLAFGASVEARHHHWSADSDAQAGQFDYYVLSLSWAPTYCLTHTDDSGECGGKGYGFVVHGLWPQYDVGGYPENCPTEFDLSAEAVARGRTVYPSERLMQHEWQAHGTCSALDALSYVNLADRATAAVRIPAELEAPRSAQNLRSDRLAELFHAANPQMPADALTLACNRASFSELRVCLTKELAPRSCGRGVRSNCPQVALRIPASRP